MKIIFWTAYILALAEFTASPVNVLRGSKIHLQRFREVGYPMWLARSSAYIELLGVVGLVIGFWQPVARLIGGLVLAACFVPVIAWAVKGKRSAGEILALLFFVACALVTALY